MAVAQAGVSNGVSGKSAWQFSGQLLSRKSRPSRDGLKHERDQQQRVLFSSWSVRDLKTIFHFGRFQMRGGASSPAPARPWPVAVVGFAGWGWAAGPVLFGGKHVWKASCTKGTKKNCDSVVLAIEGFGRLSSPLLRCLVLVFLRSILIYFPVFWLQFSGNLLSVLQSMMWITWRCPMSFGSVFWWLGPVHKAFLVVLCWQTLRHLNKSAELVSIL